MPTSTSETKRLSEIKNGTNSTPAASVGMNTKTSSAGHLVPPLMATNTRATAMMRNVIESTPVWLTGPSPDVEKPPKRLVHRAKTNEHAMRGSTAAPLTRERRELGRVTGLGPGVSAA